jgi:tetratricopeptide (TPR) repeat protein
LALVVFIGVAGIGVFSVWQTVNARREAREVLSDARLYLDEIVRLRDKAQKDAGNASTSATAAETARDAVGARIVVVDEAAHRLATVIADGIVGAFSLWMGLAEFHRRTDRPDAAISAMDGAARLVEESKVQNVHFCDYLAATYDSLGASDKALDWVNKAMELTKGRRPHEHFLRGTVHLNHRRPVADATLRQQDFVDAEAEFTQALELQSEVEPGEKLDDLVLGKTYLFRGKARLLRAKQAAGEEPPRLLRLAREDCDQAKGTLLGLKEANPAMAPEAERWLTEVDRCIAEIND